MGCWSVSTNLYPSLHRKEGTAKCSQPVSCLSFLVWLTTSCSVQLLLSQFEYDDWFQPKEYGEEHKGTSSQFATSAQFVSFFQFGNEGGESKGTLQTRIPPQWPSPPRRCPSNAHFWSRMLGAGSPLPVPGSLCSGQTVGLGTRLWASWSPPSTGPFLQPFPLLSAPLRGPILF